MNRPMDIFAWLQDAHDRCDPSEPHPHYLFRAIRRGTDANDGEAVRSGRIEFERLAETYGVPWLGVFGRHWELQYRLTKRREGATAVADAVAAFERSHRDDTIDCPQSMCTVQDLCIAYGNVDGPGYAEETVAAAKDGLDRIDVSWPCWDCLSTELVGGFAYDKDYAAAVEQCVTVERDLRSAGTVPSVYYATMRLGNLLDGGQLDAAVEFDGGLVRERYNSHYEESWLHYDLVRARMLLKTGDAAGALEIFVTVDPLDTPRLGDDWRTVAHGLIDADELANDDRFSSVIVQLGHHFANVGAWRRAFNTFADAAEFAARRGAIASAMRCKDQCVELANELAKPLDAPERLTRIDEVIEAAPAEISELAPIEQDIASLEESLAVGFEIDTFMNLATLLHAQGWNDLAESRLWEQVQKDPTDEKSALLMMQMRLSAKGSSADERLEELATLVSSHDVGLAEWIRANAASSSDRWEECAEHCANVVENKPDAKNTRRLWANALRELGRYDEATDLHIEMTELDHPEGITEEELARVTHHDGWSGILLGSLSQRWDVVRAAATTLSIELRGDSGPVEERWESCNITFADADTGRKVVLTAERIGPVTARVAQIGDPSQHCRYNDVVVFDPSPLNELPEDATDEHREWFHYEYASIDTISHGGFTAFGIEGPWPEDEDAWPTLRDGLFDAGFGAWSYNFGQDHHRELNDLVDILYVSAAIPADKTPADLHAHLTDATKSWRFPMAWPVLAEAAGTDAEHHQRLMDTMWGSDEEVD